MDQACGPDSTADNRLNWMLSMRGLEDTMQYLPGQWIEQGNTAQTDDSPRRVVVALDDDIALSPSSPIRSQVTEIVAKHLTMVNCCQPGSISTLPYHVNMVSYIMS